MFSNFNANAGFKIMNAFQKCTNTSDAVPLYLPQHLYLKPSARLTISIHLGLKMMGKTITHYEVMERLRELVRPDEFALLKVTKTTLEIIRFEAELDVRNKVNRVVSNLDNKLIKLKDFSELIRVKSAEYKGDFPARHDWDSFFRDAKDMNEMKQGERPDTVHISNVPTKWFVPPKIIDKPDLLPSEKIFYRTFEKFGSVRNVDIPICDPYRSKMKSHISGVPSSSFEDTEFFEGYVQFKDYIGFCKCMDALRGMKLMRKCDGEAVTVNIYVDFDKSKHLSEGTIRRRDIIRDRLVIKQKEKEDKELMAEEEKKKIELANR